VLVELGLVEQRYAAVREVLDDAVTVTDVARRYGVARQTVHAWLRRYAAGGLAGLVDQSSRPASCPHQMAAQVEARIVELRRAHPGWGPRTIAHQLAREGWAPLPGRSSIYRCLVRHGLISPQARKRRRGDYKRWERARAMELWQMDVVGGVGLADGSRALIVSGIDDHSRFVVCARVVARATARATCDALKRALGRYGAPAQILTDNGKVFTGRFGPGTGQVLFDRICAEHGIKHLLTAPRSPTTTGKIERWHKTLRREFLDGKVFADLADAQTRLDAWVAQYNHHRPHQSLGMAAPWERFRLATDATAAQPADPPMEADTAGRAEDVEEVTGELEGVTGHPRAAAPAVTRVVAAHGVISFASARYHVGRWLAGQTVQVVCDGGLVQLWHRGVLVATHARRHRPEHEAAALRRGAKPPMPRPTASAASVTRKVDSSGGVCFAGTHYRVGNAYKRRQVQVAVLGNRVEISIGTQLIKVHKVKHDRTREHGALANPGGRPNRINAA
jgi:transposase InsO family protein